MSAALAQRQALKYRNKGAADCTRGVLQPNDTFTDPHDAAAYYAGWNAQCERRERLRAELAAMSVKP